MSLAQLGMLHRGLKNWLFLSCGCPCNKSPTLFGSIEAADCWKLPTASIFWSHILNMPIACSLNNSQHNYNFRQTTYRKGLNIPKNHIGSDLGLHTRATLLEPSRGVVVSRSDQSSMVTQGSEASWHGIRRMLSATSDLGATPWMCTAFSC